jgi:hypothetical protein
MRRGAERVSLKKKMGNPNSQMIAIAENPVGNPFRAALLFQPDSVQTLEIGDAPVIAVKINPAVAPGEKRMGDGNIAFGRTSEDQRAIEPPPDNFVSANANNQARHVMSVSNRAS